jgi:pimeloyl-ACP methyl ester carboxylesterase
MTAPLRTLSLRVLIGVVLAAVLVVAAGASYNAIAIWYYRSVAGVPGKIYDVDGYRMHLYCTGSGSPTVVLSAGLGDDSLIWAPLQPALARTTRVCSYDRAGFGWSDPRPNIPDSISIAKELHGLLQAAGIMEPIILLGHSISGLHIREYATLYRSSLAGMVFVDGSTPLQDPQFPAVYSVIDRQRRGEMFGQLIQMTLGWFRLTGACNRIHPGYEAYAAWIRADSCIPEQMTAVERELDAVPISGEETIRSGPFGALPILIFSRDPQVRRTDMPADDARKGSLLWDKFQENLKRLSTRSRRIIARGSDHYIFVDRADLVIREVTRFINQVRGNTPPSTAIGSTVEE